ncbi:hypothetical protein BH09PLA1_BH09PLA1_25420 [soil metagenome]
MDGLSFVFAHVLKARLRDGVVETPDPWHFRVTGRLDAPSVLACIEIQVPQDFAQIIERPPRIWCRESWMRFGEEWHNDDEGGMCWVLRNEWRDVLSGPGRSPRDVIRIAGQWLMNNVTSLITRHHYAHLAGLKRWLKEWDAWPHYEKGVKQYEREQAKRGSP